ncbi:Williams-Beuren syndrome chromosomal region 27 protein-like [Plakobranchus ocellatus]|uniref:Williams-Beuren syndrome chromosomal region 27 protein-like n=1 Tax=Plakobranchus ocellatus TaxID=259542 RepID=A0AAV4B257_9GAST|nr:Williams-Beuren syndrome chromosomal region 27 protein-like [Plakobranchus ocellatus]
MTWLNAKDRHILRYSQLYTKQGLDVLVVKSELKDFLWPPNSMTFAEQLYEVLENQTNSYDHFFCHTMSLGSYNWNTLRMFLKQKGSPENVSGKFRGQIFDSVTAGAGKGGVLEESPVEGQTQVHALDRMVKGMISAKKRSPMMKLAIKSFSKAYFAATKSKTVRVYEESLKFFREEPLKAPTLFFASRDDPMCDAAVLEKLVEIWKKEHGFPVSIKVWEESAHAQHYIYHTEEYERLHGELLKTIFSTIHQC